MADAEREAALARYQERKRQRAEEERERAALLGQHAFESAAGDAGDDFVRPAERRAAKAAAAQRARAERRRVLRQRLDSSSEEDEGEDEDEGNDGPHEPQPAKEQQTADNLLRAAQRIKAEDAADPERKRQREEAALLAEAAGASQAALSSAAERYDGRSEADKQSLTTSWRPTSRLLRQPEEARAEARAKWRVEATGDALPPLAPSFEEMRLPAPVLRALAARGIAQPSPIQAQGIPAILSGRDFVGIASTGSGKTIAFAVPLLLLALEDERRGPPLRGGEGPFGLVMCPSRELARQIRGVLDEFARALADGGYPRLRSALFIGGEDKRAQLDELRRWGAHAAVATPGRLNDLLNRGDVTLARCRYVVLDEGDRMLDLGFDEEVAAAFRHFRGRRQTLLFSATMPHKFQQFALDTLVRPVRVSVGRAGAASLNVTQDVVYVKRVDRLPYLLQSLQKTPPPALVFCDRQEDVDDVQEYLLTHGVRAAAVHGRLDQEERNEAVDMFLAGQRSVLVATDVAAKGLDFPGVAHVVNYDMPDEIENYVHRIGRTGRGGATGLATTFINAGASISALADLKSLLAEAGQRVPRVLRFVDTGPDDSGCTFCGGLGHRITECPKLGKQARRRVEF